jgi:hypothetical protein
MVNPWTSSLAVTGEIDREKSSFMFHRIRKSNASVSMEKIIQAGVKLFLKSFSKIAKNCGRSA